MCNKSYCFHIVWNFFIDVFGRFQLPKDDDQAKKPSKFDTKLPFLFKSKQELRCSFVLTVISCPDLSRFSQLCKSTSTPQLYTPSSGSETGSPDAVQTVEGDSTSASSLRSQLPVDPVRDNENEGESNLESYAVFFLICFFFFQTVQRKLLILCISVLVTVMRPWYSTILTHWLSFAMTF